LLSKGTIREKGLKQGQSERNLPENFFIIVFIDDILVYS